MPNRSAPTSFQPAYTPAGERTGFERLVQLVTPGACLVVGLLVGITLLGWFLGSDGLIYFPFQRAAGTMNPLTGVILLCCAFAIWLLRQEGGGIL